MRHQNTNSRFPVGRQQRTSVIRDFVRHKLAAKGYLIAALNDHSFCWVRPNADAQPRHYAARQSNQSGHSVLRTNQPLLLDTVENYIGVGFQRGAETWWWLVANDGIGGSSLTYCGATFAIANGGVLTLFIAAPPDWRVPMSGTNCLKQKNSGAQLP
jgi:hypothetical protein